MNRLRRWGPVIAFLLVATVSTVGVYIARTAAQQAIAAVEQAEATAATLAERAVQRAEELAAETKQRAEDLAGESEQRALDACERSADVRQVILDLLQLQEPPLPAPPGADDALIQLTQAQAARQKRFLAVAQQRLEVRPCTELVEDQ